MITSMHAIIYSKDAEGVRAFLGDVMGLSSVDAGVAGRSSPGRRSRSPPIQLRAPRATNST